MATEGDPSAQKKIMMVAETMSEEFIAQTHNKKYQQSKKLYHKKYLAMFCSHFFCNLGPDDPSRSQIRRQRDSRLIRNCGLAGI
jgi:hypothetical protein